jgi:hypothetical protein
MKKNLLFVFLSIILGVSVSFSQTYTLELRIVKNGDPITDTLDDGTIITLDTSSDDAEQENDEMDALFDDDIDAGWEGDPEDNNILTAGMRFQGINILPGATIESAYITVWSHEGKSTEDVADIDIYCDATGNSETFSFDALITDRPATTASVNWVVEEEWGIWEPYQTPDLKDLVQEIIDRPDWSYGNAISFIFAGKDQGPSDVENAREWEAFENISDPEDGGDGQNHPERIPKLVITYSFAAQTLEIPIVKNGDPITDTLDDGTIITLDTSSDDAEQENDEMDALFDDDIDAGWEGDPEDNNILTAGLRFQNVNIPKGATIDEAYLIVHSHEGKSTEDVADIDIVGEAADNAATYDFNGLITDRPRTTALVNWIVDEEWDIWQPYETPDISPIIQEIVNREGWQAGNSLAIMLLGKDQGPSDVENAREFESFENISDPEDGGDGQNHPERIPRLIVTYTAASSIFDGNSQNKELAVRPNPVSGDEVTIDLESASAARIMIYSLSGKLVTEQESTQGKSINLKVNDLNEGIYLIKVLQDENVYTQKLVVN